MPDLDDYLIGDGGNRKPGNRYKLDDFLLAVPASPQTQPAGRVTMLPRAGEPAPAQSARELLNPGSIMPDPLQAGMIAAGETATRALGSVNDPAVRAMQESQRPSTQALREEFPVATTAGDVLATMAVPGGGVLGGAASGALISDDPLTGALFGAAGGTLGELSSKVLMRGVTPFPRAVGGGATKEVKQLARKLGVKLELADLVDSPQLKNFGTAIRRNPLASAPFDAVDDFNKRAFNRAALKSIGKKGDRITDSVLETTRKELADGFEAIGKRVKTVNVTQGFRQQVNTLLDEARLSLSRDQYEIVERNIAEVFDTLGQNPDGRAITSLSSELGKRASKMSGPSSTAGGAADSLFDLKNAVDDLFEENAGPAAKKQLTELRQKWANLRLLRDRNVVVADDINPGALRAKIQTKEPDAFRLGYKEDNELYQIARLHERVRELIPNSGTPTGESLQPGNLATTIPQRAAAKILNDPVFKYLARNNLLPEAAQEIIARAASRTGTVESVDLMD